MKAWQGQIGNKKGKACGIGAIFVLALMTSQMGTAIAEQASTAPGEAENPQIEGAEVSGASLPSIADYMQTDHYCSTGYNVCVATWLITDGVHCLVSWNCVTCKEGDTTCTCFCGV